jgi:integrase
MARKRKGDPIREVTMKDGTTRHRVVMDVGGKGKRLQVTTTWLTLGEAQAEVDRIRTELRDGTYKHPKQIAAELADENARRAAAKAGALTVGAYLSEWLTGLHHVKQTTLVGYVSAMKPVMGLQGSIVLAEYSKADVNDLVAHLRATGGRKGGGRSARSVALALTILGAALNDAVKDGRLDKNVAALVKAPKDDKPEEVGQAWTETEARTFLAQVTDDRYSAAWRLSLYGLRRGEVLGLTWDAVDLDKGIVTVRQSRVVAGGQVIVTSPKNGKTRRVPVGAEVVADLGALKMRQDTEAHFLGRNYNPGGFVVVDEAGVPMRPERYGDMFQEHAKTARLPRIRLHDLRHTAASLLKSKGVPMLTAASLLGHDPMIFAKVYGHDYEEDIRRAADQLAAVYTREVAA